MRIVLTKAQEINGKKYPLGQKLEVTIEKFAEIEGAEPYSGEWPPKLTRKKKMKTDFFKPKNIK